MKNILVLGGTNFIGRVLVEKLINNPEYQLTLFNRGKRNVGIFPSLAQIQGDRETDDYLKISARDWDCIIDCSGYYPVSFEKLLHSLKGKVKRYIFVSTISVYDFDKIIGRKIDENEAMLPCTAAQKTSPLPDAYGEKKAEMERTFLQQDSMEKIILRPSLVYGKYDYTDRFYYWLWRAKFADKIMLPGLGEETMSLTYVDDLADLIIASIDVKESRVIYNAITHQVSLKELVNTCAEQLGTSPTTIGVLPQRIIDAGLHPWQDVPLWLNGNLEISADRAKHDFRIRFTSFADSVRSSIKYYESLKWPAGKYGLSMEKEKELLGISSHTS